MDTPVLATKLYKPPPRANIVLRPRLIERLNDGLSGKLIMISAPAGFGKTKLIGEWLSGQPTPAAWLSLDDGDTDLPLRRDSARTGRRPHDRGRSPGQERSPAAPCKTRTYILKSC